MKNPKNLVRNWIYRTLEKSESPIKKRMENLKETIEYLSRQIDNMQDKQLMIENRLQMCDINNNICNIFLHKYYNKHTDRRVSDHYVSYYYEAPTGVANLGDYIQTIATEQAVCHCLNKINIVPIFKPVLRSNLVTHEGGTCIMQGWYEHKQLTFLPGRDTRPVWIGTHFTNDTRTLLSHLFRASEIHLFDVGCRDKSTMEFCQSLGIKSYFSRCLTLTLPKRKDSETKKAEVVYIVDCTDEIIKYLPKRIKKGAKIITQRDYKQAPWQGWKDSRKAAELLLAEYRKNAKLIITTALHCAQPCMAMGIPVVFINPEYNEADRFSSMHGIIPLYSINDLIEKKVIFPTEAPVFEDLKLAILKNLDLSMKESLTEKETIEQQQVRNFIERYDIIC